MKLWLIFTDLDGTLLDSQTYSYEEAEEAITSLKSKNYPIIPCTSKTHHEVNILRSEAGLESPFITENGSAIFYSENFFPDSEKTLSFSNNLNALILGKRYSEVLTYYKKLIDHYNIPARGFHEMTSSEIVKLTQLSKNKAILATKRFFSEPFILTKPFVFEEEIFKFIKDNGFRLLRGNRFYHLLGDSDKGKALTVLKEMFCAKYPEAKIKTMAIGDSKNDLEMFKVVDFPVVVKQKSGSHLDASGIDNVYYCRNDGPKGWAEAVNRFILNPKKNGNELKKTFSNTKKTKDSGEKLEANN